MKCWICGNGDANSREHKTKAGDLCLLCSPTQKEPIHYQTGKHYQIKDSIISKIVSHKIGGLDNDRLKFEHFICDVCNTTRTQLYDRGWETFLKALLLYLPKLPLNQKVRFDSIVPCNTKLVIKNMHLYFVKLFGCQIVENNMAIDISSFSKAILNNEPHPNLYLSFGCFKNHSANILAINSEISADLLNGKVAFASYFYEIGALTVNIMYAEPNENRCGLINAWHPHQGYKKFTLKSFSNC